MVYFEALTDETLDAVVAVGDVNSTMEHGAVGAKADVLLAHVEAGLPSRGGPRVVIMLTRRENDL